MTCADLHPTETQWDNIYAVVLEYSVRLGIEA